MTDDTEKTMTETPIADEVATQTPWLGDDFRTVYREFYALPLSNINTLDISPSEYGYWGGLLSSIVTLHFQDHVYLSDVRNGTLTESLSEESVVSQNGSTDADDEKKVNVREPVRSEEEGDKQNHSTMMLVLDPRIVLSRSTQKRLYERFQSNNDVATFTLNVLNFNNSIVLRVPRSKLTATTPENDDAGTATTPYDVLLDLALNILRERRMNGGKYNLDRNKFKLYDAMNGDVDLSSVDSDYFSNRLKIIDLRWNDNDKSSPTTNAVADAVPESPEEGPSSPFEGKTVSETVSDFFTNLEEAIKKEWTDAVGTAFSYPKDKRDDAKKKLGKRKKRRLQKMVCLSDGTTQKCQKKSKIERLHENLIDGGNDGLLTQSLHTNVASQQETVTKSLKDLFLMVFDDLNVMFNTFECTSVSQSVKKQNGSTKKIKKPVVLIGADEPFYLERYAKCEMVDSLNKRFGSVKGVAKNDDDDEGKNRAVEDVKMIDSKCFFWYVTNKREFDVQLYDDGKWQKSSVTFKQYCKNMIRLLVPKETLTALNCGTLDGCVQYYYEKTFCQKVYAIFRTLFNAKCEMRSAWVTKRTPIDPARSKINYSKLILKLALKMKKHKSSDRNASLAEYVDQARRLKKAKRYAKLLNDDAVDEDTKETIKKAIHARVVFVLIYLSKTVTEERLFESKKEGVASKKRLLHLWFSNVVRKNQKDSETFSNAEKTLFDATHRNMTNVCLSLENDRTKNDVLKETKPPVASQHRQRSTKDLTAVATNTIVDSDVIVDNNAGASSYASKTISDVNENVKDKLETCDRVAISNESAQPAFAAATATAATMMNWDNLEVVF